MKTITKANHKRYLTEISDFIINELKGIKVDNPNSDLVCFNVETNIGKLSIKLDSEKSVLYSIYAKFENVSKAKELFAQKANQEIDLSSGPCLAEEIMPDWSVDIVHNPRPVSCQRKNPKKGCPY